MRRGWQCLKIIDCYSKCLGSAKMLLLFLISCVFSISMNALALSSLFPHWSVQVSFVLTDSYITSNPFTRGLFILLMMEAVCTNEKSVYSETTQCYILEGSNLHACCHETLKSQLCSVFYILCSRRGTHAAGINMVISIFFQTKRVMVEYALQFFIFSTRGTGTAH
jgi:hypothetical protein